MSFQDITFKLCKIIDKEKNWHNTYSLDKRPSSKVALQNFFQKKTLKLFKQDICIWQDLKVIFSINFYIKYIDMMIAVTNLVKEQLEKFIPKDIRPKIETSLVQIINFKQWRKKNNLKKSLI